MRKTIWVGRIMERGNWISSEEVWDYGMLAVVERGQVGAVGRRTKGKSTDRYMQEGGHGSGGLRGISI